MIASVLADQAVDDHAEMPMDAALVQAPATHQSLAGFQIAFVDSSGSRHQEPLATGWASRFEVGRPVRTFPSRQGQRNFPGLWWFATTSQHVGFESWLERDHVMLLDFDPTVVALSSQPFSLLWHDGERPRRHPPDFFARLADGTGLVVDVRADDQIPAADAEVFEVTAYACTLVGWVYRRVGAPDAVLAANVRWLAGYRHARCCDDAVAARLRQAFARPAPLLTGVRSVGDPIAVLPVAYHLLWAHVLETDLATVPLSQSSLVTAADGLS
jgi:hypothetical protein